MTLVIRIPICLEALGWHARRSLFIESVKRMGGTASCGWLLWRLRLLQPRLTFFAVQLSFFSQSECREGSGGTLCLLLPLLFFSLSATQLSISAPRLRELSYSTTSLGVGAERMCGLILSCRSLQRFQPKLVARQNFGHSSANAPPQWCLFKEMTRC